MYFDHPLGDAPLNARQNQLKNAANAGISLKFNGMLRHSLGGAVPLLSLQHFIAPALDNCAQIWAMNHVRTCYEIHTMTHEKTKQSLQQGSRSLNFAKYKSVQNFAPVVC